MAYGQSMDQSFVVELGDDSVELLEGEALVGGGLLVDVGGVEQLEEVVIVDGVVQLLGNVLELLKVNDSVLVLIIEGENSLDSVLGLGLTNPGGDDIDELILADGFVLVLESVDEVQDEGVSLIQSQLLKNLVDLNRINGSATVLVEDLEGVDQLVVVLGGEAVLPGSGDGLGDLGRCGHWFGSSAHIYPLRFIIILIKFQFRWAKRKDGRRQKKWARKRWKGFLFLCWAFGKFKHNMMLELSTSSHLAFSPSHFSLFYHISLQEYNRLMSIYSGFPTRKDQQKYNSLLSKLLLALQAHVIELIGETIPQSKTKTYAKIINRMREYEQHKYLPPKFSDLLDPLCKVMSIDRAVQQKLPSPIPEIQPQLHPSDKYKFSSRSLHKQKFHPAYLPSYQSYNSKEKQQQSASAKTHLLEASLDKKQLFPSSSSKLSKPKIYKGVFPPEQHRIELSDQYQEPSEVVEHWETFNKSKIAKEGLSSKMSSNFRYRAYQALQQAQNSISKRPIPLREDMRRKLKTQGGLASESEPKL